jgi:hypothetical protein
VVSVVAAGFFATDFVAEGYLAAGQDGGWTVAEKVLTKTHRNDDIMRKSFHSCTEHSVHRNPSEGIYETEQSNFSRWSSCPRRRVVRGRSDLDRDGHLGDRLLWRPFSGRREERQGFARLWLVADATGGGGYTTDAEIVLGLVAFGMGMVAIIATPILTIRLVRSGRI